ncbi:hypothetical protein CXB51_036421 [Gossypium anomalum]|uniref:RNase H type-1 domain-containing protein n=1 Tax=Gossypium anomalum TaxID=47600 RepID=A0A8J5XWC7_9ROSI|nr:hypothetical protein CXB51_036421 [Gossypium anomalum]
MIGSFVQSDALPGLENMIACDLSNDDDDFYGVKSGYHLAIQANTSLSQQCVEGPWLTLWNLSLPPKFKMFIWGCLHDFVPCRSRLFSKNVIPQPDQIISFAHIFLHDWRAAIEVFQCVSSLAANLPSLPRRWQRPSDIWVKCNVDTVVSRDHGYTGLAVIIRDKHGEFIKGKTLCLSTGLDPAHAEVMAIRDG